jgi:hypothetical protein
MNCNNEQRCFLSGSYRDVVTRIVWSNTSVVGYSPGSNDMSIEAEKSQLLEVVTRKRLVETGNTSLSAKVICEV